jgi:hypothetical protein
MNPKSQFLCPECRAPLSLAIQPDGVMIFCANGPCKSEACNIGTAGRDEMAAFRELEKNWNEEGE